MITYKLRIDLQSERELYSDIVFTTGDKSGYVLELSFFDNGARMDLTDCALTVKTRRADGAVVIDGGTIADGAAHYTVADNAYETAGEVAMEAALVRTDGSYVTTKVIYAQVREGFGESGLTSSDNEPILAQLTAQTLAIRGEVNELDKKKADLTSLETLKHQSIPQASVEGYPVTISGQLAGEKLTACRLWGSSEGVGTLDSASGKYKTAVTVSSKNLFDISKITKFVWVRNGAYEETTYTTISDGVIVNNWGLYEGAIYAWDSRIELEAGTYTLSADFMSNRDEGNKAACLYIKDYNNPTSAAIVESGKVLQSYKTWENVSWTFTISKKTTIIIAIMGSGEPNDSTQLNMNIKNIQLERGNTATKYEKYFAPSSAEAIFDSPLRDGEYIDFINKIKLDKEYQARTRTWKDYTREEQADLIMRYVEDIELDMIGTVIAVKQINFRESICKPCQELFDKCYIDTTKPAIFSNVLGNVRFSNYLSEEEFGEIILRLQQYYDVYFTEATYYVKNQMFYFNFVEDNSVIVRVFPLEDYYKLDPDNKMETYKFGILYINEEDNFQMQDIDAAFDYIPDETNTSVIYTKDTTPISVGVKPVKFCEDELDKTN